MTFDPGLVVVVGAVLIFYLRLIGLQRERTKRVQQAPGKGKARGRAPGGAPGAGRNAGQKNAAPGAALAQYSILSPRRSDRIIGAVGALLIGLGLLLYAGALPLAVLQPYWWLPTALGVVAFSWLFKL